MSRLFDLLLVLCVLFVVAPTNAQDCKSYSYAVPVVNNANISLSASLSSSTKFNTYQDVIYVAQQMYVSLINDDRDYNSRMYVSFSNGDMIAVVNCRNSINNNFTSTQMLDVTYRTACAKSQTIYVAAVVAQTVYSDSMIRAYTIDAAGSIDSSSTAQIYTSTTAYTSPLFSQSSSIPSNACGWINNNSSYVCKVVNSVISAEYYSSIEPCADQCLATSHAIKIVDQLAYYKAQLLTYGNINTVSQIYPLVSLLIQYANLFEKAYTFVVLGFPNDDFYGLRKCYVSDYPVHDSCLAAGPNAKYIFQIRNARIWNDLKRHAYLITDEQAGTLVSLNQVEAADYITSQKVWYLQAANNPSKQASWSDPYQFFTTIGRSYVTPLYDTNNVMSGVLGADHAGYVPCYETGARNNYAVAIANNAVISSINSNDLTTVATTLASVNAILYKLYDLYTKSDKEDNINIMLTHTNGDFYQIQDCYHYTQGTTALCLSSKSNRWVVHVSNNAVFGDKKLHFRYMTVAGSSATISGTDIANSVVFDATQQTYYTQALTNGFGWAAYSQSQLGPSGVVYYARIVASSNVNNIVGVISAFTYLYQANTKYDVTNIMNNRFLVNAPIQDSCVKYGYGLPASIAMAADVTIIEYLTITRNIKPTQPQIISVLRSLYQVYVTKNNGYMSNIFIGVPNGDYFGLVNCASSDNVNVIDACNAIPSTSSSKVVYQIVNKDTTGTNFVYSYQMDLTNPTLWNELPTPFFTSTYTVNPTTSTWYTYGLTSANTVSPYYYRFGSTVKTPVRAFINPMKHRDGTFLAVVGAQRSNDEPCYNIRLRNSATTYMNAAVQSAIVASKLNIDTNNLDEAISILNVMLKAYISSAFHTTRYVFMGARASKNSFSIRNCYNIIVTSVLCDAAGPGSVAIAELSSTAIFGDSKRRAFLLTRYGEVLSKPLATLGPNYDPTIRPWFQSAVTTLVAGTTGYMDVVGRQNGAIANYLPLFDSQNALYGVINSDYGYEEIYAPKSMEPASACMTQNGGCSANAQCIQSPFDRSIGCLCNDNFTGDGYTCVAATSGSSSTTTSSTTSNTGAVIGLSVTVAVLFIVSVALLFKLKQGGGSSTSSIGMEKL